jgi:hypothetical protein
MADLVLEGRGFWAGLADGVRLPSQGGDAFALSAEREGGVYTSPALQAEFPCTHVGVHWKTDGGDESALQVELRASRDGQHWMPWRTLQRDMHGPDRPDAEAEAETFATLVHARLGSWLQARLTFGAAGPATAAVSALTLTCLDSRRGDPRPEADSAMGETEAGRLGLEVAGMGSWKPAPTGQHVGAGFQPTTGSADHPNLPARTTFPSVSPDLPASTNLRVGEDTEDLPAFLKGGPSSFLDRVVSREQWGADESLRFKDGVDQWLRAYVTPSLLVVHHTAGDNDSVDAESDVRAIYAFHAITRGWGDIGYNLLIDSSGQVYEGRIGRGPDASGQREVVSDGVVAGHALDYNYGSVGIALLGNFQERAPGTAMLDSLVDALAFFADRYGIDVTATQDYVRVKGDQTAFWRDGMNNVSGHRDCLPTECPGDNVYARLPEIRRRVDERLGARGPAATITQGPDDRNFWPGDLGFGWQGDASTVEYSARLAAFRRVIGADTIEPLSGYGDDERAAWGPWSRDATLSVPLPPDAKGIYTLLVRARDASGSVGRVMARRSVVVDRHVVVDDESGDFGASVGEWARSREVLGYYGRDYRQAIPGQGMAHFSWYFAVPQDGRYAVQASWTEAPDRSTHARYRISQGDQAADGSANQQEPGGKWVQVTEAALRANTPCPVVALGAEDGIVVADAIRLVLIE